MATWFDTHAHLDRYGLQERAALLERASSAGVGVVAVAVDIASSRIVAGMGDVRGKAVGVHPRYAVDGFESDLAEMMSSPGVLAVGECGFDAGGPSWEVQQRCFRAQCELASQRNLSLVLHIDGAGAFEQLRSHADALAGLRVIRHYFTGDAAEAGWHWERGHYLSFGNPLRRDAGLAEIARDYPPELLLIETDSYPIPGRVTEPADLPLIGAALAEAKGWSVEATRERLEANTVAAFRR
jgi:TatD DNase family protein